MPGYPLRYLLLHAVVLGCTLASCDSQGGKNRPGDSATSAASGSATPAPSTPADAAVASDACTLLTPDEASAILAMKMAPRASTDSTCTLEPDEEGKEFGGVIITMVENREAFEAMNKRGELITGMGEKAVLNGTAMGIWKGAKGAQIKLIDPPVGIRPSEVLKKIGEKIAARL